MGDSINDSDYGRLEGGSVAGGRRGEGCGDPLWKSRYCPSGTSSGGVDRRGPEEVVRGEGCDGSFFGEDEVGIGVPTHLGNRWRSFRGV